MLLAFKLFEDFSEEDEKNPFDESLAAFAEFTATLGGLRVLIFGLS